MIVAGRSGRPESQQQRREVARQREQADDVDPEHALPTLPFERRERRAPTDAGVVDENVELAGARRVSATSAATPGSLATVPPKPSHGPIARELPGDRLAGLRLARGDQHARAGAEQRFGADAANAGRPAGHQRRAAGHGEQIGQ